MNQIINIKAYRDGGTSIGTNPITLTQEDQHMSIYKDQKISPARALELYFNENPEELKQLFTYDRENGKLYWKEYKKGRNLQNEAGYKRKDGYIEIRVNRILLLAHRIIYFLENNKFPETVIDHIDGNTANNKYTNIRMTTHSTNLKNCKLRTDNTSGVPGVSWHQQAGKYMVEIHHNKKSVYIGIFNSLDDAISARKEAEKKYGYHKNHGRKAA